MRVDEREEEYGVPYGDDAVNADMDYINSEEFARKFEHITDNTAVNRTLLECSRAAVAHRNGTYFEDMYFINGVTGEIIAKQLNALMEERINYTEEMNKALNSAKVNNIPIIAIHTHPSGYPPSIEDFNSAFEHRYFLSVVVGHNGQVYKFRNNIGYIPDFSQMRIISMYNGGADVDRAYRQTYFEYGITYEIVKG